MFRAHADPATASRKQTRPHRGIWSIWATAPVAKRADAAAAVATVEKNFIVV